MLSLFGVVFFESLPATRFAGCGWPGRWAVGSGCCLLPGPWPDAVGVRHGAVVGGGPGFAGGGQRVVASRAGGGR